MIREMGATFKIIKLICVTKANLGGATYSTHLFAMESSF